MQGGVRVQFSAYILRVDETSQIVHSEYRTFDLDRRCILVLVNVTTRSIRRYPVGLGSNVSRVDGGGGCLEEMGKGRALRVRFPMGDRCC